MPVFLNPDGSTTNNDTGVPDIIEKDYGSSGAVPLYPRPGRQRDHRQHGDPGARAAGRDVRARRRAVHPDLRQSELPVRPQSVGPEPDHGRRLQPVGAEQRHGERVDEHEHRRQRRLALQLLHPQLERLGVDRSDDQPGAHGQAGRPVPDRPLRHERLSAVRRLERERLRDRRQRPGRGHEDEGAGERLALRHHLLDGRRRDDERDPLADRRARRRLVVRGHRRLGAGAGHDGVRHRLGARQRPLYRRLRPPRHDADEPPVNRPGLRQPTHAVRPHGRRHLLEPRRLGARRPRLARHPGDEHVERDDDGRDLHDPGRPALRRAAGHVHGEQRRPARGGAGYCTDVLRRRAGRRPADGQAALLQRRRAGARHLHRPAGEGPERRRADASDLHRHGQPRRL